MQVPMSYEEHILNALGRVKHKRTDDFLVRCKREFDAIRTVLGPLYAENAKLREEKAKLLTALRGDFHVDTCPCDACAYRAFVLKDVRP